MVIAGPDGARPTYTVTIRRVSAAPSADSDLAVIAAGRSAAAACFTGIHDDSPKPLGQHPRDRLALGNRQPLRGVKQHDDRAMDF